MCAWRNTNLINKPEISIGNKIVTSANPVWDLVGETGVPISNDHTPCGYWFSSPATLTQPERVRYGRLYGSGYNHQYQLGLEVIIPLYVTSFTLSETTKTFVKVITGGMYSTFALASDNTLWYVGQDGGGQSGLGTSPTIIQNWTQVPGSWMDISTSSGSAFSLGIKTDGTLWGAGLNNSYQIGLPLTSNYNTFTQIGTSTKWRVVECGKGVYSMAINDDGDLFATGWNYEGNTGLGASATEFTWVNNIEHAARISLGHATTAVLDTSGKLWVVGSNWNGQFGLGDITARTVFTEVSSAGSEIIDFCMGMNSGQAPAGVLFIIKSNGTLWAAGCNSYNIMGIPDTANKLNFEQIGTDTWDRISSKGNSVLGLKTNGTLWGCGLNAYGELGLGDQVAVTEFTQVGTDIWNELSCGNSHSIAINWSGDVVWV